MLTTSVNLIGENVVKKYKVLNTNMPGINQVGYQAFKSDFYTHSSVYNKRVDANLFAESNAQWASQFDDPIACLVCLKKGTRWVVVDQYNSH